MIYRIIRTILLLGHIHRLGEFMMMAKRVRQYLKIVFMVVTLSSANSYAVCYGYAGPGGPCYDGPGGPQYSGPGGPAYAGPGGPKYNGPGGPAYNGPGGPCYAGPGGPAYSGPGGPGYSGPGGQGGVPKACQ